MGREDQDWELFDRRGRRCARVRQEGDGYWVARPRVWPSLKAAMRRAETYAMWALPCRMPTQPGGLPPAGCYSPSARAWVRSALAARKEPSPGASVPQWEDGLDLPDFLRRTKAAETCT